MEFKIKFNKDINYFAQTNFRSQRQIFGIKTDDRRRHMYVIGKTGMGKSEMLKNMAIQDIHNDKGIAVVDPHGELVEDILNAIPSRRINDVVYFNPSDIDYPLAFNILESVDEPHQKNLVASGLIGIFKKLWADSWGPRLEYLLRNAILALLDFPGATLLGVTRILVDKEYRKKVLDKVSDPIVKAFWTQEFSKYSQQFQVEAISPIQNKVGQFLSLSLIRNIVGQVKSTINLRDIMDGRKILLINLSKGRIGEDASALLGAMMITKIQMAAMGRVDIPEEERQDFYLYVDEFQNFVTDSFADILSEARKYRLNLIIAHQYIAQLISSDSTKVRDAVFGNVGTLVTFRVGADDAEFLAKEFVPTFEETDLVNLAKFDIYLKLMIDGVSSNPFSASTLPPLPKTENNKEKIIQVSRERYASRREIIEDKIARWAGFNEPENKSESKVKDSSPKKNEKNIDTYDAKCSHCQKDIKVKFKPDGIRPVFCENCLPLYRKGEIKVKLPHSKSQKTSNTKNNLKENDNINKKNVPRLVKKEQKSNVQGETPEQKNEKKVIVEDVVKETPAEISLMQALGNLAIKSNKDGEQKNKQPTTGQDGSFEEKLVNNFSSKSAKNETLINKQTEDDNKDDDNEENITGHFIKNGEVIKF